MPLVKGHSRAVVGENIREMENAGHPRAQAIAAALRQARQSYAPGGAIQIDEAREGAEHRRGDFFGGFLHSGIPGRTDRIHTRVPADSYVLPADVVSALGEGNSLAGARQLIAKLFGGGPMGATGAGGPYGALIPAVHGGGSGPPHAPGIVGETMGPAIKRGGSVKGAEMVPVVLAGGEFVVPPHIVKSVGNGDPEKGHDEFDKFVKAVRGTTINTLKKLPGPRKD